VSLLPHLTFTAVLDILLVAVLVYQAIQMVRGRRAASILAGVGVLVMVYLLSVWLRLELLRTLLATLAPYTAFALIVMFQSDIRRVLARIGQRGWFSFGSQLQRRESLEELDLALAQLAEEKTGALIVIEREIGLRTFVESGVLIDGQISRDLLLAIFQKNAALHDGAVIIQNDRIAAAACFLPLTMNPVSRSLGTRHRAGIGVTEESDCLSVIISEERGTISLAYSGEIEHAVTEQRLQEALSDALGYGVKKRMQRRTRSVRQPQESR